MTRPDEIAALADELAALVPHSMPGGKIAFDVGFVPGHRLSMIVEALRLSATSPGDAVREALSNMLYYADEWYRHIGSDATMSDDFKEEIESARKLLAALTPAEKAGMPEAYEAISRGEHSELPPLGDSRRKAATPTPPSADLERETLIALGAISSVACKYANCDDAETWADMKAIHGLANDASALIQSAAPGGGTECCIPTDGEPSFVLLGRDPQAPELVEQWARDRFVLEPDSDKPERAMAIAADMRRFKAQHPELGMPKPGPSDPSDAGDEEVAGYADKTIINNWTGGGTLQTWTDGEWKILYAKDASGNAVTLSLADWEAVRLAYAVSSQPEEQFNRMRQAIDAVYELSYPEARTDELRQIADEIDCGGGCEGCGPQKQDRGEFCGFISADNLRKLAAALDLKAKVDADLRPTGSDAVREMQEALEPYEVRAGLSIVPETIAKKFETWGTLDLWRSDAANTVRSYKLEPDAALPPHGGEKAGGAG